MLDNLPHNCLLYGQSLTFIFALASDYTTWALLLIKYHKVKWAASIYFAYVPLGDKAWGGLWGSKMALKHATQQDYNTEEAWTVNPRLQIGEMLKTIWKFLLYENLHMQAMNMRHILQWQWWIAINTCWRYSSTITTSKHVFAHPLIQPLLHCIRWPSWPPRMCARVYSELLNLSVCLYVCMSVCMPARLSLHFVRQPWLKKNENKGSHQDRLLSMVLRTAHAFTFVQPKSSSAAVDRNHHLCSLGFGF